MRSLGCRSTLESSATRSPVPSTTSRNHAATVSYVIVGAVAFVVLVILYGWPTPVLLLIAAILAFLVT